MPDAPHQRKRPSPAVRPRDRRPTLRTFTDEELARIETDADIFDAVWANLLAGEKTAWNRAMELTGGITLPARADFRGLVLFGMSLANCDLTAVPNAHFADLPEGYQFDTTDGLQRPVVPVLACEVWRNAKIPLDVMRVFVNTINCAEWIDRDGKRYRVTYEEIP